MSSVIWIGYDGGGEAEFHRILGKRFHPTQFLIEPNTETGISKVVRDRGEYGLVMYHLKSNGSRPTGTPNPSNDLDYRRLSLLKSGFPTPLIMATYLSKLKGGSFPGLPLSMYKGLVQGVFDMDSMRKIEDLANIVGNILINQR